MDYFATTNERTFSANVRRQCAPVTLDEDLLIEGPEFFEVVLGTTQDAITIQNGTGRVIIEDNDGKKTIYSIRYPLSQEIHDVHSATYSCMQV